jgi:hypothetical protein
MVPTLWVLAPFITHSMLMAAAESFNKTICKTKPIVRELA